MITFTFLLLIVITIKVLRSDFFGHSHRQHASYLFHNKKRKA